MRVYTTGEVCALTGFSTGTIYRYFREGRLEGFRIPGSKMRRFPADKLREFLSSNGMSTELIDVTDAVALCLDDANLAQQIRFALQNRGISAVRYSPFQLGMAFCRALPLMVVLDLTRRDLEARFREHAAELKCYSPPQVVYVTDQPCSSQAARVFPRPFDPDRLAAYVEARTRL